MADHRIQCPVVVPDGAVVHEANAFRSFCDGGNEFLLDFINCPEGAPRGEIVARIRLHRDVLQSVYKRLVGSMETPGVLMFSSPLGV